MDLRNQPTAAELTADYLPLDTDDDLVSEFDVCPDCGERRVDFLAWIDDTTVRCLVCGYEYEVN